MKRTATIVALLALAAPGGAQESGIPRAADAPRPLPPAESLKLFRLPPGFRVELVASEPLLADPTAMAFDAGGRIFACELHGYNLDGYYDILELNKTGVLDRTVRRIPASPEAVKRAEEETHGTVKLLEDLDGDGKADRSSVWADRLPPCYGVVEARGGVIVLCAPDIVYLADRDGDGKAEVRETLFTGFGAGELWTRINNPRWGIDNWIYAAPGHGSGGTIRGPRLKGEVTLGSTCFRFRADGTAIEPVSGGTGGFGLALNEWGDRFFLTNSQHALYAAPLEHRYLARNPDVPGPGLVVNAAAYDRIFPASQPDPWRLERSRQPEWVQFYGEHEAAAHGYFTASCAPVIYDSAAFPPGYRGSHFSCDAAQNLVHRSLIERDGSGYTARRAPGEEEREFLTSSEQWFRPVNLTVGPDGALYIVDMYREIIEDYSAIPRYLQQQYGLVEGQDRGRIWRVVHESSPAARKPSLGGASSEALVRELENEDAWWRRTAQRLLVERGGCAGRGDGAAVGLLAALSRDARTPQARLRALWTLEGLSALDPALVESALGDPHFALRVHALRLSERWIDVSDALAAKVFGMVGDPDPSVRLQLALTLGERRDGRAVEALARLAARWGGERWMPSAIASSSAERSGRLLAAILRPDGAVSGAVSGASSGASSGAAVVGTLASGVGARRDPEELAQALEAIAGVQDGARVPDAAGVPGDAGAPVQLACLKGLREGLRHQKRGEPAPPAAGSSVRRLLASTSAEVRLLAFEIASALELGASPEVKEAFGLAARQALDASLSAAERQAALSLLSSAPYALVEPAALELLDPRQPIDLQLAAVRALSAAVEPQAVRVLLEKWSAASPQVQAALLDAVFGRQDRLPALLDAIREGVVDPSSLDGFHRAQLLESPTAAVRDAARPLLASRGGEGSGSGGTTAEALERYRAALSGPRDPRRGEAVFKERCSGCHRIHGEGFAVGPELTSANNRPDEAWLEDILRPGGRITAGFPAYAVVTRSGEVFTGILAAESATSVTLRREKAVEEAILRKDIEVLTASSQSLMPDNMEAVIGPRDLANLLAYLREAFGPAPPSRILLFDDEPSFVESLAEGGGKASLAADDPFSGKASLSVTPPQRYSSRIPGWRYRIAEKPGPGEFRYLRWAWRCRGDGVLIELAAGGAWPAPESAARRYYAGRNSTAWKAREVSPRAPAEWTVVVVDLWRDCGEFTLTGLAPTAMGGEARFDRIELCRTADDVRP